MRFGISAGSVDLLRGPRLAAGRVPGQTCRHSGTAVNGFSEDVLHGFGRLLADDAAAGGGRHRVVAIADEDVADNPRLKEDSSVGDGGVC